MSNIRKVKLFDKIASVFIKLCGGAVILCILLIIFMIFSVAKPLFDSAQINTSSQNLSLKPNEIASVGIGEYSNNIFYIKTNGDVYSYDKTNRKVSLLIQSNKKDKITSVDHFSKDLFAAHYADQSTQILKIYAKPIFKIGEERKIVLSAAVIRTYNPTTKIDEPNILQKASLDIESGTLTKITCAKDKIYIHRHQLIEDDFDSTDETNDFTIQLNKPIRYATIDSIGSQLYVGLSDGLIIRYKLSEEEPELKESANTNRTISCMNFVYGNSSLVVGFENGEFSTWFPAPPISGSGKRELKEIHKSNQLKEKIDRVQPSFRDKTFLVQTASGNLYLNHMTTEKMTEKLNEYPIAFAQLSSRGDYLMQLSRTGDSSISHIINKYAEATLNSMFGKIWYEDYTKPEYVWQSSSASNDSEPKLSLIPLIFGSLKGTFYAMILSIPIALFGAVYISQFSTARVKSIVKPSIEMMSAIPTVVVGFIAALWFAPKLDDNLIAFAFCFILFPLIFFIFLSLWNTFAPNKLKAINDKGYHFISILPVLIIFFICTYLLTNWVDASLFDGGLKLKALTWLGIKSYDQRNCLVISFALGFTVIPLVFTIAEDVLSAVPKSLTANSLALGANRWQTVWRVVLPSASPGIVAGVIIGFGRAIGETMIVLMATGNTPYIDISIFNGMRTLSANIATEIPEAPFEGTLYRVLFFSAVILFTLTFILNTFAELIRQALRKKYSQFQ